MPPYDFYDTRSPADEGTARELQPEGTKLKTPFPWIPMVAIAICLVANAYASCSIFPYAGYMVQYLGVTDDKDKTGYYVGYLSAALMIGRSAGSYFWGRFADRYGRMPVMYTGLCFIGLLSLAFGFSTNFVWAVTFRFFAGALNGIAANIKTMISEICGSEHEVVGMSLVTGCWSVGLVLGSGLGGLLAEPGNHYPTMFSESGMFGRFPYLLPNVFGAALSLIGLASVYLLLEETHHVKNNGARHGLEPIATTKVKLHIQEATAGREGGVITTCIDISYDPQLANGGDGGATSESWRNVERQAVVKNGGNRSTTQSRVDERLPLAPRPLKPSTGVKELEGGEIHSVKEAGSGEGRGDERKIALFRECLLPLKLLEKQRIRRVLFVTALFSFVSVGSQEVYPLWALSSLANGGLDWTTKQIEQTLAVCGGGMLVFQLFVYPRVVERIGPTLSQCWSCFVTIPVYLSYPPLLSMLHDSGEALVIASVAVLFFITIAANAVFINVSLANNNGVHPSQRGTLNGLSSAMVSLAKAAGPIFCTTIFAWSIDRPRPFPLDCQLVFCLFALGMVVVTAMSWNIDISPHESRAERRCRCSGGGGQGKPITHRKNGTEALESRFYPLNNDGGDGAKPGDTLRT